MVRLLPVLCLLVPVSARAGQVFVWGDSFDSYNTGSFSGTNGWVSQYGADAWSAQSGWADANTDDNTGTWGSGEAIDNHLVQTGQSFSDLILESTIRSVDDDAIGFTFRYQDTRNFYFVAFSRDAMPRVGDGARRTVAGGRLYRVQAGAAVQLASTNTTYTQNSNQTLRISAIGSAIDVQLNGASVLSATDGTFSSGRIGLYCLDNGQTTGCRFLDVAIYDNDADNDGVGDSTDNCPNDPNTGQANLDGDPFGDVCDNDVDGDGVLGTTDCDDLDASVGAPSAWYADGDGDGYGAGGATLACAQPANSSAAAGDCQDGDVAINPVASEVCDGVDNDCDGDVDDADASIDPASQTRWYSDGDGDGFGTGTGTLACIQPVNTSATDSDCKDGDAAIHPGASEVCDLLDNDCDGAIDDADPSLDLSSRTRWYSDGDGDSYGAGAGTLACAQPANTSATGGDCQDGDAAINPGASEVCDLADNDCDGDIDDADASIDPTSQTRWYSDGDSDSYGAGAGTLACVQPANSVLLGGDCDDADAAIKPGASEVCDLVDNDCDGLIDDADPGIDPATQLPWYGDADSDGYGAGAPSQACAQPVGGVAQAGDCDDTLPAVNPGATEICDGVDNDCDGAVDDADPSLDLSSRSAWYGDGDGDNYGLDSDQTYACAQPSGTVASPGDCNDADPAINPDASEVCDGFDDDCDGDVDDADADLDLSTRSTYYADGDGDGYGTPSSGVDACMPPLGFVPQDGDCDDTTAYTYPGAPELCDDRDNDCDLQVDEDVVSITWYFDGDGDGYGDASNTTFACAPPDSDWSATAGDCDDGVAEIFPGAFEVCNQRDDDCDGDVDEDLPVSPWFRDADGDGYGDASEEVAACEKPAGYVADDSDCDDDDDAVWECLPHTADTGSDSGGGTGLQVDTELPPPAVSARTPTLGLDAVAKPPSGCGCSVAPTAPVGAWLGLLALGLLRRRMDLR